MMTDEYPEWFTPRMKYLRMKEEFQENFLKESTWGEFGSKEEICALTSLLEYFKMTLKFAEQFPQLLNGVIVDNKNLVIQRMIPLQKKLYEQILLAVVEGAAQQYTSIWKQPCSVTLDKIEHFLLRRKIGSLLILETKMCSEVPSSKNCTLDNTSEVAEVDNSEWKMKKNMSKAATNLRKIRNQIYSGMRNQQNVQDFIEKFHSQTEGFISSFGSELSVDEAETFRRRVRITRNAAKASLSTVKLGIQSREIFKPKTELKGSDLNCEDLADRSHSQIENDNAKDAVETILGETGSIDNSFVGIADSKQQDTEELADELALILPDVPSDSESDPHPPGVEDNFENNIDEQIHQRLTRLKFFTQAWSNDSPSYNSTLPPIAETEAITPGELFIEIAPVESTEEDRQEFNRWYYDQVDNPRKYKIESGSQSQSHSDLPTSFSTTIDLSNPMNMDTSYMTYTNEQQMIAMATSSQTSDLAMVSPPSDLLKSEISKQQDLYALMISLYYMQVNVVTIVVFTAFIILDKLSMELLKPSGSAIMCVQPAEDLHLHELGQGCVHRVQDQGVQVAQGQGVQEASNSSSGNGYVPPWKRNGISYTKLHSAHML